MEPQLKTPWESLFKKGGTAARLDALGWAERLLIAYVSAHAVKSGGDAITDLMEAAKAAGKNEMELAMRPNFKTKKVRNTA